MWRIIAAKLLTTKFVGDYDHIFSSRLIRLLDLVKWMVKILEKNRKNSVTTVENRGFGFGSVPVTALLRTTPSDRSSVATRRIENSNG